MKEYANSPETSAKSFELIKYANLSIMKTDIIKTLFPNSGGRLQNVHLSDLNLPKAGNRSLSTRKIASLALKAQLFVTSEQRNYYPQVAEGVTLDTTGDEPVVKKVKKSTKVPILNSRLLKAVVKHKADSSSEQSNVSTQGTMFAYFKKSPPINTNMLSSTNAKPHNNLGHCPQHPIP